MDSDMLLTEPGTDDASLLAACRSGDDGELEAGEAGAPAGGAGGPPGRPGGPPLGPTPGGPLPGRPPLPLPDARRPRRLPEPDSAGDRGADGDIAARGQGAHPSRTQAAARGDRTVLPGSRPERLEGAGERAMSTLTCEQALTLITEARELRAGDSTALTRHPAGCDEGRMGGLSCA